MKSKCALYLVSYCFVAMIYVLNLWYASFMSINCSLFSSQTSKGLSKTGRTIPVDNVVRAG